MTSMFEQFEQDSLRIRNNNMNTSAEMSSLGYINMTLEHEIPIFTKTKKDFTPAEKITHVAISNNFMVIAMANNELFRMNLHNPAQSDRVALKSAVNCRLTNLFLDPTGNHLLLSFAPRSSEAYPELLYLSRKSTKLKQTTKFKGHEFTEVAWNNLNESETDTGPILLGTSKGCILETEIVADGDKFFPSGFLSIEQYWKQIFDIGKNLHTPITGLEYFRIPGSNKCAIFAATPTRLYFFTGKVDFEEKPVLHQVFNHYLNVPEEKTYIAVQSGLRYSRLKFYSDNLTTPNSFAWMTEQGVAYGQINLNGDGGLKAIEASMVKIPYPKPIYVDYSVSPKYPIAIALTEFHILLAYSDTIRGMCLLNQEIVYEDNYNEAFGKLINIVKDPQTGVIWAISENAVFKFKVTKEERNVWQIFADKQQFELAKKYSKANELFYNQVLIKEADMLFNKKQYAISAQRYAETRSRFEEICLKFIQADQEEALKIFLKRKLETLKPQDKTQITIIVIWVTELYLTKLEEKRLEGLEQSAAYADLQKEFESFLILPNVSDCVRKNKSTIQDLMASHGDKYNLMKLTIVNKDFEQLIQHHVYKNDFTKALDVLKGQNNYNLYYQFAPILIWEIPKLMVKALIDCGRKLSPVKLLPALVISDGDSQSQEVIKYLEHCVNALKCPERAIHNLLLSLYAKYDPEKLMKYLEMQGQEISLINFDVHFALRLCQEKDLTKACVHLSSLLGLWETAIELALKIDIDLAKEIANKPPEEDIELRKKLWLRIAEHVVSGKNDIKEAMDSLKQCDLIKIEDILPFFSDFVTIDHIKQAICDSLKDYNQYIQDLKDDMQEATKSAEVVRQDIQSFRNRYTYVSTSDTCEICNVVLLIRPFYMFPCQHKFHTDCLKEELLSSLGSGKRNKLNELEKRLKLLVNPANVDNISNASGISDRDMCKAEIDNILASECLYCGENMIRKIDKPFIEDCDYERIKKDWE